MAMANPAVREGDSQGEPIALDKATAQLHTTHLCPEQGYLLPFTTLRLSLGRSGPAFIALVQPIAKTMIGLSYRRPSRIAGVKTRKRSGSRTQRFRKEP
jgi:hypothetical protein